VLQRTKQSRNKALTLVERERVVWIGGVLGGAPAVVRVHGIGVQVHGVVVEDVEELLERLHDEDERDERREALLGEARDVAHEGRQVKCHHDEQEGSDPHADPEAQRQVVQVIVPGGKCTEKLNVLKQLKYFVVENTNNVY
jgi:hypothetical protein